ADIRALILNTHCAQPNEMETTLWAKTNASGRVSDTADSNAIADVWKEQGFILRDYVTRSQAVELLAAERAEHDNTIATLSSLIEDNAALIHDLNRIKDHETELVNDNAALTARIKEL